MPPLRLATILSTALPPLPREARAVVDLLACTNGLLPSGSEVVTFLGLRTRHQVARVLRRRRSRSWQAGREYCTG